ncbi:MAB_1171c family putative transporter [Kitasatospora sp. NPDC058170]|uniref:MAB_1171c family putative transporter n=1 Tax=Kitasatospora sp. NPDC058170 TaxID=3346364 RepID=UPI0036D95B9E
MLVIGSVWKTIDLVRAPHDKVLRMLVCCLSLLAAGELLSFPEFSGAIDRWTVTGVNKILFNGLYMAGLAALILFFVSAVPGERARYLRRVRFDLALLGGVLLVIAVLLAVTPESIRGHTLGTPHMARPSIALFYLVGNSYFIYAYLASGLWTLRFARMAALHLAVGLRIVALGLLGMTVSAVGRIVLVCARIGQPGSHQFFNQLNWSLTDWSMGLMLVGISYSACLQLLAHLRSVVRHRRMYRELTPLWTVLSGAYPELVLHQEPAGSRRSRWWIRRTHERFYRRLIECRDGLVRLSPYLVQVAPTADLACLPADQLARYIAEALALKPVDEHADTSYSAARIAFPAADDLRADVGALIAVSRAYARDDREKAADYR